MTTDSVPAAGDARRLLSDVRALAHRVRLDQRVTWVALLVLAAMTFAAIPLDWAFLDSTCTPLVDGMRCEIRHAAFFWPPALLLAYGVIAFAYLRIARARGLATRVLPYVVTGVALTALHTAVWLSYRLYLDSHPVPTEPFPYWVMLLDRLVAPWGTIGIALLVLAWLERNVGLLVFTLGYLAIVLVPINTMWRPAQDPTPDMSLAPQVINGVVLLAGAVGFALERRWPRAPHIVNAVLLTLTVVGFVLALRWHRW